MSFSVAQRKREIGIRIALGARHAAVMGLVLRHGAMLIGLGLAAGLGGAAALTRSLRGLFFGITPLDSATFVTVTLLFAVSALLAAYVPARKATVVDPLAAIRSE
jgi:ABC-type antimicrobial peptide transport system permease subunit